VIHALWPWRRVGIAADPPAGSRSRMKVIDVNKQVRLSLAKTLELVISGVRFRLFRAAITVVIISLAVAFLMTMLTESIIGRNVAARVDELTASRRLLAHWISQFNSDLTRRKATSVIASLEAGSDRCREFKTWGDLTDTQLSSAVGVCQAAELYLPFFEELTEGDRRSMAGRAAGLDIFDALSEGEAFAAFESELGRIGKSFPGEGVDAFRTFLSDWVDLQPALTAVMAGHAGAAAAVQKTLIQGRAIDSFFADIPDDLPGRLGPLGFVMDDSDVAVLRQQASLRRDAARINTVFSAPLIRRAVSRKKNLESSGDAEVGMLFDVVSETDGARWFLRQRAEIAQSVHELDETVSDRTILTQEQRMADASRIALSFAIPAERIVTVARWRQRDEELQEVERRSGQTVSASGFLGFTSRTVALLAVSLVVCVVGIANAMLMSVTERFREIATMKCLGATDGFIMVNFILESCMQGIVGATIGVVLGFALGLIRSFGAYDMMALANMPVAGLLSVAGVSFALGVVISAMAAVYPASVAARLAPMEAMRIE